MKLQDRLYMSIVKRSGEIVLRSDVENLGSASQLTHALKALQSEGRLIRIGSGVYAKAKRDVTNGSPVLAGSADRIEAELFERLGVSARVVRVEAGQSGDLFVLDTSTHRAAARPARMRKSGLADRNKLATDPDLLPTQRVSEFVRSLAQRSRVAYTRTALDDWAEAVTRASGDDVRLDETGNLLVALKRKKLIDGAQMARLLSSHLKEMKHV